MAAEDLTWVTAGGATAVLSLKSLCWTGHLETIYVMVVFAAHCSKGESETSTVEKHNSSKTNALTQPLKRPFNVSVGVLT